MILGTKFKPKEPPVAPGTYLAVCVGIYDLGDQESHYKKTTSWPRKIAFTFDLTTELNEVDGKEQPRQLTTRLNYSKGKNSYFRAFLSGWVGKKLNDEEMDCFDTDTLLGAPAVLAVVHSEDGQYANIKSAAPPIRGVPVPPTQTPLQTFDIDAWDDKAFEELPEWVQETIKKSLQYQKEHAPADKVDLNAVAQQLSQTGKVETSVQDPGTGGVPLNAPASNLGARYQMAAPSDSVNVEEEPPF